MEEIKYTDKQIRLSLLAKALSHPVRIKILEILSKQNCCYSGDMVDVLPIARSTLSQHLKELKDSGLIKGEINPPKIKYCINKELWDDAHNLLTGFFAQNNE